MSKNLKNIKITEESHKLLKEFCDKKGIKIYRFLEKIIKESCEPKKDIYGEL
jgi:hypothetical protein